VVLTIVAVAAVVVLLAGWVIRTYNRLVRLRNRAEEAWSGMDIQLQRRADLVPGLVETVRGYAGHERQTLEAVIEARSRIQAATGPKSAGDADDALEGALRQLFAVAEDYPDLKASTNFLQLQRDLVALEEEIMFARRYHNGTVEQLNTAIQSFPTVLVARPLGFSEREDLKAAAGDRQAPTVGFSS
jgi:LemA protein